MNRISEKIDDLDSGEVLGSETQRKLLRELSENWDLKENRLNAKFEFEDFQEALEFVEEISSRAEEQFHHPEIRFSWGWVEVAIYTHEKDGLTVEDFLLAEKIDKIN